MQKQSNYSDFDIKMLEKQAQKNWLISKVIAVLLIFLLISLFISYHWFLQAGPLSGCFLAMGFLVAFIGLIVLNKKLLHGAKTQIKPAMFLWLLLEY